MRYLHLLVIIITTALDLEFLFIKNQDPFIIEGLILLTVIVICSYLLIYHLCKTGERNIAGRWEEDS